MQTRVAVGLLIGGLSLGAAWWFLSALAGFTEDMQKAYRRLVFGVALFGLSLFQIPVLGIFNWWDTWYVFWGVILLPFVVAIFFMYVGLRKFGLLLQIQSRFMPWRMLIATTIVVAAIFVPIGHVFTRFPTEGVEIYDTVLMWCLTGMSFCAILAGRIEREIGETYKDAMRWMKIAMIAYALATFQEYLAVLLLDPNGLYAATGAEMIPFAVAGGLFLEAGRRFYLLTMPIGDTDVPPGAEKTITDEDYIKSITQTAALASRLQDIEPILRDLRFVTASYDPTVGLSAEDRRRLLSVYHQLQKYLSTNEPLRQLAPAEILKRATPAFRALLSTH